MSHDVFISYSSEDKAVADAVCATLEAHRLRCWIAPRDILPGQEYAAALTAAIGASRVMVLVLSSHSNVSPQVLREVERAVSRGVDVLPIRIDSTRLSDSMEFYISSRHWLDALTPPLERHLQILAKAVSSLLDASRELADPIRVGAPPSDRAFSATPTSSEWIRSEEPRPARTRPGFFQGICQYFADHRLVAYTTVVLWMLALALATMRFVPWWMGIGAILGGFAAWLVIRHWAVLLGPSIAIVTLSGLVVGKEILDRALQPSNSAVVSDPVPTVADGPLRPLGSAVAVELLPTMTSGGEVVIRTVLRMSCGDDLWQVENRQMLVSKKLLWSNCTRVEIIVELANLPPIEPLRFDTLTDLFQNANRRAPDEFSWKAGGRATVNVVIHGAEAMLHDLGLDGGNG